ncbi:putative transcriptional regulator, partial [Vibrio parahaemolyticus EKP-008]
NTSEN